MRDLYFCGDIHGEFRTLVWTALEKYRIKNSDIIVLGDFGMGFDKKIWSDYARMEDRLNRAGVTIHAIRGNHDDPKYFKGGYDKPRLKFLEDHKVYNICDREIYTIGGACSTDIEWRKLWNDEAEVYGSEKRVWWEGENVEHKYSDLPLKVDIIISHEAPLSFDPVASRSDNIPSYQYTNIIEDRKYLDYVYKEVRADYWYYGHYHTSYSGSLGHLLYKCLGIMKFSMAPEKINHNPQGEIENVK